MRLNRYRNLVCKFCTGPRQDWLVLDSGTASQRCNSTSKENQCKGNDAALPRAPIRWLVIRTVVSNGLPIRCYMSNVQQIIDVMHMLAQTIRITVALNVRSSPGTWKAIMPFVKAIGGISCCAKGPTSRRCSMTRCVISLEIFRAANQWQTLPI